MTQPTEIMIPTLIGNLFKIWSSEIVIPILIGKKSMAFQPAFVGEGLSLQTLPPFGPASAVGPNWRIFKSTNQYD
jgi:hypothetical protein